MNLAASHTITMRALFPRKRRFRPCAISLPQDAIFADVSSLPLFAFLRAPERPIYRPRATPQVKHCRECGVVINRSSRGRCKPCATIGLKRSMPEDFLPILRKLGSQGAARHYHASLATVTRWRRELELKPQARMKKGIGQSRTDRGFVPRPLIQNRDMSLAGQAADFLRGFGAVYRCDERGRATPKGTHWRRGFAVMGDDELMHRAQRLGWCGTEM